MKTELKYRTFDELMYEVASDFVTYNNENMIEPGQLIKVAQRVTYDLGLKLHGTKEVMLEVDKRKTKLPSDFYVLNYALLCNSYKITSPILSGRQTENVILNAETCTKCGQPDPICSCQSTYSVECSTGEKIFVQVVETHKTETKTYTNTQRVYITESTGRIDALDDKHKGAIGYIKNGFLYTNIGEQDGDNAKLFISYQGNLEDRDGNLLVLDHPVINEYYEYAIKQRILENLYINGEDVVQKLQLIEQRLRAARNNALSIVNTPDFEAMQNLWVMNRKAQYNKYYDMFKAVDGW